MDDVVAIVRFVPAANVPAVKTIEPPFAIVLALSSVTVLFVVPVLLIVNVPVRLLGNPFPIF
jgi:hypothetical protein